MGLTWSIMIKFGCGLINLILGIGLKREKHGRMGQCIAHDVEIKGAYK